MQQLSQKDATAGESQTAGIYIHIPFCKQACVYCNFHFSTSLKNKDEVLATLMQELELRRDYLSGQEVTTIYLGGGTPSLLNASQINYLADKIMSNYNLGRITEFTLEANPDDLTQKYLHSLKSTPVNRLSIGIQSFKEADLKYMKRAHTAQQSEYAVKAAQDEGYTNISIDLIYGTPGLTDLEWKQHMQQTVALQVPHFSAYALTVEENTKLHYDILHNRSAPADPSQAANQFEMLMEFAQGAAYDHYEISNFAQPGHYALHNTNYWLGNHYLGIGPSAHSYNGTSRQWNVPNNALYSASLATHTLPPFEQEQLSATQKINEYIMTSLRTIWGCSLNKLEQHGDKKTLRITNNMVEQGYATINQNHLILTNKGKLYADKLAAELFLTE